MIVFKTFLKILNKNKAMVILFTSMLIIFSISSLQNSQNNISFTESKPDVLIINNDENIGITKDLIKYITDNSNVIKIENDEDKINDALFFRDVNYVIYIPENYRECFLQGKNPEIKIKSTGDYLSKLEEMILSKYIKIANIYQKSIDNEDELIKKINETLSINTQVEIASKLNTSKLSKATYYYNFASYSILFCLIFIIGLIMSSFNEEKIRKRIVISSTNYKNQTKNLLLSSLFYSIMIWIIYIIISFIIVGKTMLSINGLLYIVNSFIFCICITSLSLLIGNIIHSKGALSGITNVIALGSSFLCGAFVPVEFLPDSVLKIAHIIPTYYYINTNEIIKTLEKFNIETLKPILSNIIIILVFTVIFIILNNIVTKKNRKI